MADLLPAQIDYTSRDFSSLREDIIARVQTSLPDWQASDPADFGVVLVEAFAHLGDIMSYYIDRAANESSLSTATRRSSVLALARDLGYTAAGYVSSSVTLTFSNTSAATIVVPAGTVATARVEKDDFVLYIPFETDAALTVTANAAASVSATQGQTMLGADGVHGESIGMSSGIPGQFLSLPSTNVVKSSVEVFVYDGVNYYPWAQVSHLSDYLPTSRVFRATDDGYDNFYVEFGDGVSGAVPTFGHTIFATYRVVDGTNGNVATNTVTEVTSVPGLTSTQVTTLLATLGVTNETAATGGTNPEDLSSIRNNAAQAYRSSNRAVTLEDYQSLALQVPGCGKASARASTQSLVALTVAPSRSAGAAEAYPGFNLAGTTTTTDYEILKYAVETYVDTRRLAGVLVTMTDVLYTPISVTVTCTALSSVLNADVAVIVKQALVDRFDYVNVDFGATVLTTDIISLVASLGVTESVTVTVLKKTSAANGVSNLEAAEDEIFLLPEANVVVAVTGGAG